MTALERAQELALILLHVKSRWWARHLPDDAAVRDDCVWLQGVRMEPIGRGGLDGWRLTERDRSWEVKGS